MGRSVEVAADRRPDREVYGVFGWPIACEKADSDIRQPHYQRGQITLPARKLAHARSLIFSRPRVPSHRKSCENGLWVADASRRWQSCTRILCLFCNSHSSFKRSRQRQ